MPSQQVAEQQESWRRADEIRKYSAALRDNIDGSQRRIVVALTRDARKSSHWNTAGAVLSQILWAGLQAIPFAGGYFMLINRVLSDPARGAHMAARTQFGSSWLALGGGNSAMAPLDSGNSNYNYGNGRVGAFNGDVTLKRGQFEADCASLMDTRPLLTASRGRAAVFEGTHLTTSARLSLLEWRGQTLASLATFTSQEWTWYCLAQARKNMMASHEGLDDLHSGVFGNA